MTRGILGWSLGTHSIAVARIPADSSEPDRLVRRAGRLPPTAAEFAALLTDLGREVGTGPGAEHAITMAKDLQSGTAPEVNNTMALSDAHAGAGRTTYGACNRCSRSIGNKPLPASRNRISASANTTRLQPRQRTQRKTQASTSATARAVKIMATSSNPSAFDCREAASTPRSIARRHNP